VGETQGQPQSPPCSDDDAPVAIASQLFQAAATAWGRLSDAAHLRRQARSVLSDLHPVSADLLVEAADLLVLTLMLRAWDDGWEDHDLVELVRRRAAPGGLTCLSDAALLVVRRIRALPSTGGATPDPVLPERPGPSTVDGMQDVLQVAALLSSLPPLDDPWDVTASSGHRLLWLELPCVQAKVDLVTAVADALGCDAVGSESLGCCAVIGDEPDLDAVEELATSLLVQATAAMALHERDPDERGVPRRTSFDRSFLMSYIRRIEERLAPLPLQQVLTTRAKPPAWADPEGWVAGRAAADVAQLDVPEQVTRRR
jgi:hypothetical protein